MIVFIVNYQSVLIYYQFQWWFLVCFDCLQSADFDNELYEDYYPTFQVALTNLEPVDLYLKESRQNENGDVTQYDWQSCVDLQGKFVSDT